MVMLLTTLIIQIGARTVPEQNEMNTILIAPTEHFEHNPSASLQFTDLPVDHHHHHHQRQKREATYDPYDVYYYYPTVYTRPAYYESPINRRDTDDNRITEKGQKYKYTPLFQYKSTQAKRRKLFVPNLFG